MRASRVSWTILLALAFMVTRIGRAARRLPRKTADRNGGESREAGQAGAALPGAKPGSRPSSAIWRPRSTGWPS